MQIESRNSLGAARSAGEAEAVSVRVRRRTSASRNARDAKVTETIAKSSFEAKKKREKKVIRISVARITKNRNDYKFLVNNLE